MKATLSHPVLQKTLFGWILGGATTALPRSYQKDRIVCNVITNQDLHEDLTKFWEIEHCCNRPILTREEKLCEEHFMKAVCRNIDGRFIVKLPFKEDMIELLGQSKSTAQRRFCSLERRLQGNLKLKNQYVQFIREYIQLEHMEAIEDSELTEPGYYLPHHPVIKDTSLTTKLRVIFDASCKTSTGYSLNDVLMVGPVLQPDILDIILRFRLWQFVMTADIEKMYRQVWIDDSQKRHQRILWRENPQQDIHTYQLKTVTYGTSSASYLATRALQQIAHLKQDELPKGTSVILSDFYVDDLVTGSNCIQQANIIRDEVITILLEAGFNLQKWASNVPALLPSLSTSSSSDSIVILDKDESVSTLGLQWHSVNDVLQYDVKHRTPAEIITKRTILSSISRIFDPLGLLGPVTVTAKIFMQHLWQLKIGWDETVPLDVQTRWRAYESQLCALNGLKIPRKVIEEAHSLSLELHGFCDASMEAYGACVYVRTSYKNFHRAHLLCAKSRVAPARSVTLPRLELCAAQLLAQLMQRIRKAIPTKFDGIYYWSDSTITLGWIQTNSKRWSVFVANRVGQIQELSDSTSWNHVKTTENPANIISRGISPTQLLQAQLWWKGPPWLSLDRNKWEIESTEVSSHENLPEARKTALIAKNFTKEWSIFYTISSMRRLQRITAYILRFIDNSRKPRENRNAGSLTAKKMKRATLRLARIVQSYSFFTEIKALHNQQAIPRNSKLLGLAPFLDHDGIIRVRGRLACSKLPYAAKHPIVLPSKHNFTKKLIEYEHERLLHAGSQMTLASLRQRFWPISGRSAVRQVTRACIKCFKTAPSPNQVIMANLPTPRVSQSRPFMHCDINYAGPFMIRDSKKRNSKSSKTYAAVFVCLSCKAVHIELVFDLSTEAFLNAFKRFISRRGKPSDIYTDNGTNFVGAARELKELRQHVVKDIQQERLSKVCAQEGISWHFNPPQAPHFGGIWEAALQQRTKWKFGAISLKPGQLVIIQEDNTPPLCWPLARIEEVHPGTDGIVRAATVRTNKGTYKRPATRLCPLPLDSEEIRD
ncbi:uncharacterized protein [Linepithema humile]|uniref:uncharacterized protein n=1 Tax=Linepithema humile TaxID=83485 RepID=UPI00351E5996